MRPQAGIATLQRLLGALALWSAATAVSLPAHAADPCHGPIARALVLGTGGSKGAFEAGAIYHLIVHRGCDFVEISGNSVGALNGALLAQAPRSKDPAESLANLRDSAENLVKEWGSFESGRDVMRTRPLSKIRFALFGLDSLENFAPLRAFVETRVAPDRLAAGRELRVGTMSFDDGHYHEILINRDGRVDPKTAHDFIFASAIVPVFGRMPVIPQPGDRKALQFNDAGVRHSTPVTSYFETCSPASGGTAATCTPLTGSNTPPHPRIEQLFVIVTSPYTRRDDTHPVFNSKAVNPRTGQIDDGRQILVRMFDLLIDTLFRADLDDMLTYNDLLAWHAGAPLAAQPFSLGSFNRTGDGTALPYEIALIAPQREESDPMRIFDVAPETQRREMFCGCIAADTLMQRQYGQASMADRCGARFPALSPARRRGAPAPLTPAVCRVEQRATPPAGSR
jgi:hypothetical protein